MIEINIAEFEPRGAVVFGIEPSSEITEKSGFVAFHKDGFVIDFKPSHIIPSAKVRKLPNKNQWKVYYGPKM